MMRIINAFFRKFGWELQRVNSKTPDPPAMSVGLEWLSDRDFHINTVLDVGASNGCWSKECMEFFPEATYVLFEPQPVHTEDIEAFVQSCKQKVIPVKKAVGATVGQTLFDASDPFGGALATQKADNTIEVSLTTIDASIAQLQLEGPYLLKLDTHGFEKSILDGATLALEKAEILIIEAYNFRITDEALLFWELCAYLSDRGFRPIDLIDILHRQYDDSLWQMDIFFIKSTWEGFNYISYI
jgi:FkbM family methyltransferase